MPHICFTYVILIAVLAHDYDVCRIIRDECRTAAGLHLNMSKCIDIQIVLLYKYCISEQH